MNSKTIIFAGMFIFSTIGSFVPKIWGAGIFSMSGVFFSAIGGVFGIWIGYKISRTL